MLQNCRPEERYLVELREAIDALSLPPEDKQLLIQFFDPSEPLREDRFWAIFRNLPESAEKARLWALITQGQAQALSADLGRVGWLRSNQILHKRWEKKRDTHALGAVLGVTKDPADIPGWAQQGAMEALKEGKRIPMKGSGHTSPDSPAERYKKAKGRVHKAGKSRNHREAAKRLVQKLRRDRDWLIKNRGLSESAANREAKKYTIGEFQKNSQAKDKSAILAIFHELLKDT
jgi:hypothetical protein